MIIDLGGGASVAMIMAGVGEGCGMARRLRAVTGSGCKAGIMVWSVAMGATRRLSHLCL
jgi:hypothetical protein